MFVDLWPRTPSGSPHPHFQGVTPRAAGGPHRGALPILWPPSGSGTGLEPRPEIRGQRSACCRCVLSPRGWAGRPPSSCRHQPRDTYVGPPTEDWKCTIRRRRKETTFWGYYREGTSSLARVPHAPAFQRHSEVSPVRGEGWRPAAARLPAGRPEPPARGAPGIPSVSPPEVGGRVLSRRNLPSAELRVVFLYRCLPARSSTSGEQEPPRLLCINLQRKLVATAGRELLTEPNITSFWKTQICSSGTAGRVLSCVRTRPAWPGARTPWGRCLFGWGWGLYPPLRRVSVLRRALVGDTAEGAGPRLGLSSFGAGGGGRGRAGPTGQDALPSSCAGAGGGCASTGAGRERSGGRRGTRPCLPSCSFASGYRL